MRTVGACQIVHQKVTTKGMENSRTKPWKRETTEYSLPEVAIMIGRVVSIEVTPPAEIGASGPQNLARSGARSSVAISLMMFDSRAMVPSSAPR